MGWLFIHTERGLKTRYAPDLIADPVVNFINGTFVLWVIAGLVAAVPARLADRRHARRRALTGLLWGGAVRMLVLHHATYSINSLCHFFGAPAVQHRRRVAQPVRGSRSSRSARRGTTTITRSRRRPAMALRRWQFDPSAWVIWALEKTGLAWDVVRISPERQAAKLAT